MKLFLIRYKLSFFILSGIAVFFIGCNSKTPTVNNELVIDSVKQSIIKSKKQGTNSEKQKYLINAYYENEKVKNDSIKNKNLISISYELYKAKDTSFFKKANKELLLLSKKLNDTNGLAEAHWNYGSFYANKKAVLDSSYYYYNKANEFYSAIGNTYSSGKMLYNMAYIEGRLKNYTGSEVLVFKAISKFKPLKKYLRLYMCYNHLGQLYYGLEEYNKAHYYYEQSLKYLDKIENLTANKNNLFNNIGLVHLKQGNYEKAKSYFKNALVNLDPKLKNSKAKFIDNLAYSKLLNDETANLPQEFYTALAIRDSLNNKAGIIINKIHLAEYYIKYNDTSKAISYATDAKKLAVATNINSSALKAFKLLSKIDKENTKAHLKSYITLKDKLEIEERKTRNKFTRIRFETDEYAEETKRLSQQRIWISIISITFILILSLLYFLKRQHSKNKELLFNAEQQKTNEEIYSLILKQQTVLEEGRLQERNRISAELHDGVLGKLFGTRMGMGFLNLSGDATALNKYQFYVDELQNIEKEIRVISHELKNEILSSKFSYTKIIEDLAKELSEIGGYNYTLVSDDNIYWDEIDEKIKINFYRIAQEALLNINKYAQATEVKLSFKIKNNTLKLLIKDNGIGFDLNKKRKGIGLSNIHSRMKNLGGNALISSSINSGTNVVVSIEV